MKSIKIDKELLEKQINLCDEYAEKNELFDGIATLLDEIWYAMETNLLVKFEMEKGE